MNKYIMAAVFAEAWAVPPSGCNLRIDKTIAACKKRLGLPAYTESERQIPGSNDSQIFYHARQDAFEEFLRTDKVGDNFNAIGYKDKNEATQQFNEAKKIFFTRIEIFNRFFLSVRGVDLASANSAYQRLAYRTPLDVIEAYGAYVASITGNDRGFSGGMRDGDLILFSAADRSDFYAADGQQRYVLTAADCKSAQAMCGCHLPACDGVK
jgi:hypothetical protein